MQIFSSLIVLQTLFHQVTKVINNKILNDEWCYEIVWPHSKTGGAFPDIVGTIYELNSIIIFDGYTSESTLV